MQIYGQGTEGRAFSNNIGDGTGGTDLTIVKIALVHDVKDLSVQLITTQGAGLTATWAIDACDNYSPAPNWLGQPGNTGSWVSILSSFTPAITTPIAGTTNQLVMMAPFPFRAVRVTFTRTAGTGQTEIWIQGKGA